MQPDCIKRAKAAAKAGGSRQPYTPTRKTYGGSAAQPRSAGYGTPKVRMSYGRGR